MTLTELEAVFQAHEHTVAAVEAIGSILAAFATVAAVVTSLYLARRNEKIMLKASVGVILGNTLPLTQYAAVIITNVGMRIATLPAIYFEWSIPFRKKQQPETLANFVNAAYRNSTNKDILSGKTLIIPLCKMSEFEDHIAKDLTAILEKITIFPKARFKCLSARLYTQDGTEFPVKFSRAIRERLKCLVKT